MHFLELRVPTSKYPQRTLGYSVSHVMTYGWHNKNLKYTQQSFSLILVEFFVIRKHTAKNVWNEWASGGFKSIPKNLGDLCLVIFKNYIVTKVCTIGLIRTASKNSMEFYCDK